MSYKVDSTWGTGHNATVTITNRGAAVNGWTLTWTTPAGQTLVNAWNATVTVGSGKGTARNLSYNGSLATGASTNFGMQVNAGLGGNGPGTRFALNGVRLHQLTDRTDRDVGACRLFVGESSTSATRFP